MLALFAARISPAPYKLPAAHATLWLAALCPFTAIYAAEPFTEALTIFTIAMALWAVARFQDRRDWLSAIAFTIAVTYAALLRPDGALVGIALAPPMLLALMRSPSVVHRRTRPTANEIGCPTLAASLFLRLGWDATNPNPRFLSRTNAGCPILAAYLFLRLGWDATIPDPRFLSRTNAGCPTLAASLFLRLGWDATNPNPRFLGRAISEAAA